jgi:hypothetical protein
MAQAPRALPRNLRRSTAGVSTDSYDVLLIAFLLVFVSVPYILGCARSPVNEEKKTVVQVPINAHVGTSNLADFANQALQNLSYNPTACFQNEEGVLRPLHFLERQADRQISAPSQCFINVPRARRDPHPLISADALPSKPRVVSLHDLSSFVLIEDFSGHRDTNNFVGFPARGQIYRLQ